MITIDKAIAQEKELFEHCKKLYEPLSDEDKSINPLLKNEIEYHKQIAEWLEELKAYQQHEIICNKGYNAGYNKAVDDFAERLKPIIDEKIKGWTNSDDLRRWCERSIDEIAEQLKEMESENKK